MVLHSDEYNLYDSRIIKRISSGDEGQNDVVRTSRINSVFALIPEILRTLRENKKGEATDFSNFSFGVTMTGTKPKNIIESNLIQNPFKIKGF